MFHWSEGTKVSDLVASISPVSSDEDQVSGEVTHTTCWVDGVLTCGWPEKHPPLSMEERKERFWAMWRENGVEGA